MDALTINFALVLQIIDEQFFHLCQINELIRFERNADGDRNHSCTTGDV
ncbi:hypothetical protein [Nostoc sp. LEGE 12450]|nr:hypothetical protein [Nostoc sp. LEGE 12450]